MDVAHELRTALQDRYRVHEEIGRGGMATVYKAHDLKHDRTVAIKVLHPDLAASIGAERFAREIRIAAQLSHPGILTVFDSGDAKGLLYYVMPFVEGESLRDRLQRETQLPIDDAIAIACEVAEAVGFAHAHGVIHRDIKPENILLQGEHAIVADFGIARPAQRGDADRLTESGVSLGTAAYMSPEQAAGYAVDGRCDIYALGCTLYEMLVGMPPFTGPNSMAVMARHNRDPVPSIEVVRPSVPEQLEAAVMHALEKVPADRLSTMEAFKSAILGEPVGRLSGSTPRYSARYRIESRGRGWWTRRRTAVAALAVLALAVGTATLAHAFAKRHAAAPSDASRVAVLYFDDDSRGPLRYLADGLTESLIERLSSIAALDVASANAVRAFRGHAASPDSVGRTLKVGTIVRGAVEPAGNKVRVTVRLVDAASDADIARKIVDLDTAHIVSLQGELATDVANFLRERVGDEVRLRGDRAETSNDRAWVLVERAGKLRKDADSLASVGLAPAARQALAAADSMLAGAEAADAHSAMIPSRRAGIAYARARLALKDPNLARVAIDSGLTFASRALALAPNDADALEYKGELLYARYVANVDVDPKVHAQLLPDAEKVLTQAVSQNKNQAGAWAALSQLDYSKPDIQAANLAALNAYRADAYLSSADAVLQRLFWTSHDLEQFPEATRWCDEGRSRFPHDPFFTLCRLWLYTTRYPRPDIDSAWIDRERYLALVAAPQREYAGKFADVLVGGALARANLPDSARHVLLRSRATPSQDPSREIEGYEAAMRVILGDQDEAVTLIKDYLTVNPDHWRGFATRTSPWWRDLQSNPKFKALMAGAR